jgi:hypothetical protein
VDLHRWLGASPVGGRCPGEAVRTTVGRVREEAEIDWDGLTEIVVRSARDALAAGPLTLAELTAVLRRNGVFDSVDGEGVDLDELVDECLLSDDSTLDFADGRIAIVDHVLDGVTLTHRVTAGELERGVLDIHPDLHGLMWGAEELRLVGTGGVVTTEYPFDGSPRFHEHGSYVGPDGWLAGVQPDDLIALRFLDGAIELIVDVEPTGDVDAAADALRRAYDIASAAEYNLDIDLLVLEAANADAGAFRTATVPLGELVSAAGLRLEGAWVRKIGEARRSSPTRYEGGGIDQLRRTYGLDDCCVTELRRLVDVYLAWVAAGPTGRDAVTEPWSADQLAAAAYHGAVGAAFGDFLTATGTGARETMDAFAEAIAGVGSELSPFALHIRAVSALTGNDAASALADIEAAVTSGSNYVPALDLAAILLADAGRPIEALAARRRATSLGWPPADTASLQAVLHQNRKTGRNDPCPCGSGRKYKQCCQRDPKLATTDRRRLAVHQAVQYAVHGDGREHLYSLAITAATEAMGPNDDAADAMRRIMLDPFMIDIAAFESGRVDEYLEQRGDIIPTDELAWLETLADTPLALWASARRPDGSYHVRDVLTGEQHDGVRFPGDAGPDDGEYVLARMMADAFDGLPGPIGPTTRVPRADLRSTIELLDGFADPHAWAQWLGRRVGGLRDDPAGGPGSTERNKAYFAVPAGGWEAARALLDAEFTADGPGWIQFVELDGVRLVRAGLRPEGEELVVSTSSLRRLGDIRNVLEPAGFRHLRTDLTEPDDEFTDGDQYEGDWDDDDDVEFSAIDAMFEPAPGRGPSVTDAVLAARDDERA